MNRNLPNATGKIVDVSQPEVNAAKERAAREAAEEARRAALRAAGTPVTRESFMAWKVSGAVRRVAAACSVGRQAGRQAGQTVLCRGAVGAQWRRRVAG